MGIENQGVLNSFQTLTSQITEFSKKSINDLYLKSISNFIVNLIWETKGRKNSSF